MNEVRSRQSTGPGSEGRADDRGRSLFRWTDSDPAEVDIRDYH